MFNYVNLSCQAVPSKNISNVMVVSRRLLKMGVLYGNPGGGSLLLLPTSSSVGYLSL